MTAKRRVNSLRLGPRALQSIHPSIEGTSSDTLPLDFFRWSFRGIERLAVISRDADFGLIAAWAYNCIDLELEPVIVLAQDDDVCSAEELAELISIGCSVINVGSPGAPDLHIEDASLPDSEWTVERIVAFPDREVVEAYYSLATTRPISVWPMCSEHEFWLAYGSALTYWVATVGSRMNELAAMYFSELPSSPVAHLAHATVRTTSDLDDIADCLPAGTAANVDELTTVLKLPFVFDVRRQGMLECYGRLPGLQVVLPASEAVVTEDAAATSPGRAVPALPQTQQWPTSASSVSKASAPGRLKAQSDGAFFRHIAQLLGWFKPLLAPAPVVMVALLGTMLVQTQVQLSEVQGELRGAAGFVSNKTLRVRFVPTATSEQVTKALVGSAANIVGGPDQFGDYWVASSILSRQELRDSLVATGVLSAPPVDDDKGPPKE